MKLLDKLTYKNLLLNKKRSIVTIIGIILSVALLTAVSAMVASFKFSFINYEKKINGNYHYSFKNVSKDDLSIFKNNRNIENFYVTKELGYAKINSKNEYKPYSYIMEMDSDALNNLGVILEEGTLPKSSNEILIPEHLKTNGRVDLKVNDYITLEVGERVSDNIKLEQTNPFDEKNKEEIINTVTKTYKIVGIIRRPAFENFTAPGYTFISYLEKENEDDNYIVFARYNKKGLKNHPKTTADILGVDPLIFEKGSGLYPEYQEKYDKEMAKAKFNVSSNTYLIIMETMAFNDNTLKALFLLATIIIIIIITTSVFCIKNSISISITERIKQYGMLKSIGATSNQIKKNVYYEVFLLGIIGIPLGIIFGLFAAFILIIVVQKLVEMSFVVDDFLVFKVSISSIIIAIILSILTLYLSSIKSAKISSKTSPINAIRNSSNIKLKKNKLKTPNFINKLFGLGGVISYKNIKRNKRKYRPTVISIIVCVAIYISLSYFVNTAFSTVKMEHGERNYNILLTTSYENEKEIKETLSLDTINRYSKVRYYQGIKDVKYSKDYLNYNDAVWEQTLKNNVYPVISLGEKEYQSYLNKLHLSYFDSKDKVILINNIIQTVYKNNKNINVNYNALDYKENDLVTATNNKTYEIVKVTNIRPLGFESRYNSPYFIVSDEVMDTLKSDSNVSIFIKSSNANKTQDDIEKIFNYKYYSLDNLDHDAELVNRLYTLIAIFLYGFIIVIALIGVTNIFNTLTTSIELRKNEFAILKSIGMTSKEFNKMIFLESFFFCFKSLIIGIPIGICLSYLIYLSFNQEIMFSFDVPYKGITISIVLVFVLIFTLMKYSVTKANNSNIIDTIRNENI